MVKKITSKSEFDAVIASGKTVFVDFYAEWCGPCRMISPVFDKIAAETTREDVEFYKLNIDEVAEVASELGIASIPRFYAFKDGERVGKEVVGANQLALRDLVTSNLQ